MKKSLIATLFGVFTTIYFLVLYIQSYEKTDYDAWGVDYSFDKDILTKLICSVVILGFAVYFLLKAVKNEEADKKLLPLGIGVVGFISTFYPLGRMFKYITENIQDNENNGDTIVSYLIWSIFGAFILVYGIISYLEIKKNNNK